MNFTTGRLEKVVDIAHVERSVRGKKYKKGSILIQLSATSGQIEILKEDREADSRYAVIMPNEKHDELFVFYSITKAFPEFLHKYRETINLPLENLQFLKVTTYDIETEKEIARLLKQADDNLEHNEKMVEKYKEMKKNASKSMFV